jgi:carboxypeptidase C (cathepsin A)
MVDRMKTVVMLGLGRNPLYDYRIGLQKESLEKAGYNVCQLFLNYINGLHILRIDKHGKKIWKQLDNISLVYSAFVHMCPKILKGYLTRNIMYHAVLKMIDTDVDVIHAYNFDTMLLALKLKRHFKCKVIYDMREYYAKMSAQNFKSIKLNWYLWLDKYACKRADWIFVMTDDQYKRINRFTNGDGKF